MSENQIDIKNKFKKKTSKLALASFISLVFGFLLFFLLIFIGSIFDIDSSAYVFLLIFSFGLALFLPFFLGIMAKLSIQKNKEKIKGNILADISTLIPIFLILIIIVLIIMTGNRCGPRAGRMDTIIRVELAQIRAIAEIHYDDNNGYTGFTLPAEFTAPECSADGYQINVSADEYAACAQLCLDSKDYFCVDSRGAMGVVRGTCNVDWTTTKCPLFK